MRIMAKLSSEPASPYMQKPIKRKKQVLVKADKPEPQHLPETTSPPSAPFSSYEEAFSSAMATTVLFKNRASQTLSGLAPHAQGTAGGFASVKEETSSRHGYMRVTLRAPDKPRAANNRPLSIAPSSSVMSRNAQMLKSYAAPTAPPHRQSQAPPPAAPVSTALSAASEARVLPAGSAVNSSSVDSTVKTGVLAANSPQQTGALAYINTHSTGQALKQGSVEELVKSSAGGSEQSAEEKMHAVAAGSASSSMGGDSTTQSQATQGAIHESARELRVAPAMHVQPAESSGIMLHGAAGSSQQEQRTGLSSRLSRASHMQVASSSTADGAARHKQADGALLQLWTMECIDAVRSHTAQKHLRQMLHTNAVPVLTPLPLTPTSPRGTKKCYVVSNKHRQLRAASADEHVPVTTDASAMLQQARSRSTGRPLRATSPTPLRASSPVPLSGTSSTTAAHDLLLQRQSVDSALELANAVAGRDLLMQRQSVDSAMKMANTAVSRCGSPDAKLHGSLHANKAAGSATKQPTPYGSAQRRQQYHKQLVQARSYVGGLDLPGERFLSGLEGLAKDVVRSTVLGLPAQSKSLAASGSSPALAQATASTPSPFLMGIAVDQLEEIHYNSDTALPSISELVSSHIWHPPADQLSKSGKHASAYQFADLMQLQGPSKEAFLAAACTSEPGPTRCETTWESVTVSNNQASGLCSNRLSTRSGVLNAASCAAQSSSRDDANGSQGTGVCGKTSPTRSPSPSMYDSHTPSTRLRTAYSSQGGRPHRQSQLQSELSQYSQLLGSCPGVNHRRADTTDHRQPSSLHEAWVVVDDMQTWADKIPATYTRRLPSVTAASALPDVCQISPRSRSTSPQHRTRSVLNITLTSTTTPDPACAELHIAESMQSPVSRGRKGDFVQEKSPGLSGKQQTALQPARPGKDLLALSGSSRPNTVMSLSRCTTATSGRLADTREALRKAPAGSGALGRGWAACMGPEGSVQSGHMGLGRSRCHLSAAPSPHHVPAVPKSDINMHDVMDHSVALEPTALDSHMDGTVPQAGQSYGLEHEDSVESS